MENFLIVALLCIGMSLAPTTRARPADVLQGNHTAEIIKNLTKQVTALNKKVSHIRKNADVAQTELHGQITNQANRISDIKNDTDVKISAFNSEVKESNIKIEELEKGDVNITRNIEKLQLEIKKESDETKNLRVSISKEGKDIAVLRSSLNGTLKDISEVRSKMSDISKRTDGVEAKMEKTSDLVKFLQEAMHNETHSLSERISTLQKLINSKVGDLQGLLLKTLEKYYPYGLVYAGRGYPIHFQSKRYMYAKSFDDCYNMCAALRKEDTAWDSISYRHDNGYCACKKKSYGFEYHGDYVYLRFPPYKYN